MQEKQFKIFFIIGIIMISFITFIITSNTFHLALIWNTFLAIIPLFMLFLEKHINNSFLKIIIIIVWILFLPNSFYTLTDLIHIQSLDLYKVINYYEVINLHHINAWIELLNIFLVSTLGFWIGCINVTLFVRRFHNRFLKIMSVFTLSFLCSIGIYMGRFLRFNSWDIINPFNIMKTFIDNINLFTIQFVVIMTMFIFISCLLYYRKNALIK